MTQLTYQVCCQFPGCGRLTFNSTYYCNKHQRLKQFVRRPPPTPVGYKMDEAPASSRSFSSIEGAGEFTSTGKQVLRNGKHFADAVDVDAAQLITKTLNSSNGDDL